MLFAINHTQRSFVLFTVWEKEPVLYGIVLSCYHLTKKLSRQPYSFTSSEVIMVCSGSRPWPQHNCSLGVSATGIEFQPLPSFITPNWLPKLAFGRQLPRSVTQVISSFDIYKGTRFPCLHKHSGAQCKSETASKLTTCTQKLVPTQTDIYTHNKHAQTHRMEEVIPFPRGYNEGPIIHCC